MNDEHDSVYIKKHQKHVSLSELIFLILRSLKLQYLKYNPLQKFKTNVSYRLFIKYLQKYYMNYPEWIGWNKWIDFDQTSELFG